MQIIYHTTVTSGLRAVAHLARASPYATTITAPIAKAEEIASKQVARYPSLGADHGTRTALRQVGLPALQMVVLPPDGGKIAIVLLANQPPDDREQWQLAIDPDWPLIWRNYQLAQTELGAITWRLSEQARTHYRQRINRLITGRGGQPTPGQRPYQLPADTARKQVLALAEHLTHYPGFSGIRNDVFAFAQHSTRVWRATHPDEPAPMWPTMPYVRFGKPRTASLRELTGEDINDEKI
ncbi:hypothetical protein [Deinococcus fonticola]|uniref:hypothetical protein n=1 Tax=Deinococcus fonticola TaxID=2528713 RepID=UPI001F0DCB8D|nr:hypothetical protein [Deinococcus fonticola]